LDTTKNLSSHPSESVIDFFFTIVIDLDVFFLSWIISSLQEGLETIGKSFFPEELLVLVLSNEFHGG
jgi:hypothetical protein